MTPADQIREVARENRFAMAAPAYDALQALADHLESESSGGLREALEKARGMIVAMDKWNTDVQTIIGKVPATGFERSGDILAEIDAALADHLESEPSGGLKEAHWLLENAGYIVVGPKFYKQADEDEWQKRRDAFLAATPKPPESAEPGSEGDDDPRAIAFFEGAEWFEKHFTHPTRDGVRYEAHRRYPTRPAEGKEGRA